MSSDARRKSDQRAVRRGSRFRRATIEEIVVLLVEDDEPLARMIARAIGPARARVVTVGAADRAPNPVTLAVSGAIPFQPMAMVWDLGKLFVADRIWLGGPTGGQSALRLVAIDPVTAIGTELWRTQGTYDWQIGNAYLTASRYGELVLSLNLTNGMADVASFRADDGQPIQSGSVARIAGPTVSDGSGFTVLIEQQMTDTTSSARLEHRERDTLLGGVCGTTWLRSVVGNQSGSALGNPAVECQ